jgi:hypothetical protein
MISRVAMLVPKGNKRSPAKARLLLAFLTTCAAWLVALSHGAAALHFALISHQICADHGEVTHASATEHSTASHAAGPQAESASEHAGHEHCPLVGRRVEHAALLRAPGVRVEPPALTLSLVTAATTGVPPSRAELLLAAPKQSPPV